MKKIKFSVITTLALFVFACSNDSREHLINNKQINYEAVVLSTKKNVVSLSNMLEYDQELKSSVDIYKKTEDASVFETKKIINHPIEDKTIYSEGDLSDIYTKKQKKFLVSFYNELANSEDGNILDIVINHKNKLKSQKFSYKEYNQIKTLLIASEQSILVINSIIEKEIIAYKKTSLAAKNPKNNFWKCMKKNAGKAIGRGMVTGAITGAIGGAKIGASGGTVALPGVGTATGAVGGAVFGATAGAISGAITATIWQSIDCGAGGSIKDLIQHT